MALEIPEVRALLSITSKWATLSSVSISQKNHLFCFSYIHSTVKREYGIQYTKHYLMSWYAFILNFNIDSKHQSGHSLKPNPWNIISNVSKKIRSCDKSRSASRHFCLQKPQRQNACSSKPVPDFYSFLPESCGFTWFIKPYCSIVLST